MAGQGRHIADHTLPLIDWGRGVEVDYEQAAKYCEQAAAHDIPQAIALLGCMHFHGRGRPASWRRARELNQRALIGGDENSGEVKRSLEEDIKEVSQKGFAHAGPHLKPSLLPCPPQFAPLMDRRVEVHATSRQDLNGKRGLATDFHPEFDADVEGAIREVVCHTASQRGGDIPAGACHPRPLLNYDASPSPGGRRTGDVVVSKSRYTIRFDSGETFKLRPQNVAAIVYDESGDARAKGRGGSK